MKMRSMFLICLAVVMTMAFAGCGSGSAGYTTDHARSFVYIFDNNSVNLGAVPARKQPMTLAKLKAQRAARVHKHAAKAAGTSSSVNIASGTRDLYLYDLNTGTSTLLNGSYGSLAFETVQMSSYGTKLLFSADDSNGYVQIYLADGKLKTITQLTTTESDHYDAQISPDGSLITFDDDDGTLYYMSASGGTPTPIKFAVSNLPLNYAWGPAITPDNQRIVFTGYASGGDVETIFSVKLDGSYIRQLTNPYGDSDLEDFYPAISPDGTTLAFTRNAYNSDYGWAENVYTVSITGENDSTSATQLTSDGESWYPVYFGTKLLYLSYAPNYGGTYNDNIFSMGTDGSSITQLTDTPYETMFNGLYYGNF